MTRLEALVKIIASLAWPLTIAGIVIVFHPELTSVLKGITKLEFPGGSIEREIKELEDEIPTPEPSQSQAFSPAGLVETSLIQSGGDPRLALARIGFALEQELFRPSALGLNPPIETSRTTSRIDQLIEVGLLDNATADNIRDFLKLTEEITQVARSYSEQELGRALEVGARLVTDVRRRIVGAELLQHFRNDILWHGAQRSGDPGGMWSAVATSAPDFEYDYNLFVGTIEKFNREEAERAAVSDFDAIVMDSLSLGDFVQILEFREQEIIRVLEEMRKPQEDWDRRSLEWMWPEEWGDVHWNGPVLRDVGFATFDLEKLWRALEKYRRELNG